MATRNSYGWMGQDPYLKGGGGAADSRGPLYIGQNHDTSNPYAMAANGGNYPPGPINPPPTMQGTGPYRGGYDPRYPGGDPSLAGGSVQFDQYKSLMDAWNKGGINDISKYGDSAFRDIVDAYKSDYLIPYGNLALAERTQAGNEKQFAATHDEQVRMNNLRYALDRAGAQREDEALRFSQFTNQRDFTEGSRQFDAQHALNQMLANGQISAEKYANETNRLKVNNDMTLGQGSLANDARRINNDYNLGLGNQKNDATRIANEYNLGQGALTNQKAANMAQDKRWQGQTANEAFANQTDRTRAGNDFYLGQGQLVFQNRELNLNDAYRQKALGQEADLTREKFQNDLTQTRYNTFGRAAAPNFRAAQSWY